MTDLLIWIGFIFVIIGISGLVVIALSPDHFEDDDYDWRDF